MFTYLKGSAVYPDHYQPGYEVQVQNIIVHGCNNVGTWGAGFVLELSKRSRTPERAYKHWHETYRIPKLALGDVQVVEFVPEANLLVCNMITQTLQPGIRNVRYSAIHLGFVNLRQMFPSAVLHMPRIGCGLGGGEWDTVEKFIREAHETVALPRIFVYDL